MISNENENSNSQSETMQHQAADGQQVATKMCKTEPKVEVRDDDYDVTEYMANREQKHKPAQQNQNQIEPQPGPSGLYRSPRNGKSNDIHGHVKHRVMDSSDDDDDDDDIGSAWRRGRHNGQRPVVPKLRIESPTGPEPFNDRPPSPTLDLLSAPDLQLDWISDSDESNTAEFEYVPSPAPITPSVGPLSPPSIDLTRDTSDEEDQDNSENVRNSTRLRRPRYIYISISEIKCYMLILYPFSPFSY